MLTGEITIGAPVELAEAVGPAPAGAHGAITDVLDRDNVIVELTSIAMEPILDRIVVVPLTRLRAGEPATGS